MPQYFMNVKDEGNFRMIMIISMRCFYYSFGDFYYIIDRDTTNATIQYNATNTTIRRDTAEKFSANLIKYNC